MTSKPLAKSLASGFTLIEVLIAMTLLSAMMALLFGAMKICADSWEKGESKIADVSQIASVYNFFQHHLSAAIPLSDSDTSDPNFAENFSFEGEANKLKFVSSFPASTNKSGLQLFTVQEAQDDDGKAIRVSLRPFYPATLGQNWEDEQKETEVDVLKHVKQFELHYFGADDIGGEAYWQDQWSGKEFQPRLVKINIVMENKDDKSKKGIFWPEMIIDLKATQSAVNLSFTFDSLE